MCTVILTFQHKQESSWELVFKLSLTSLPMNGKCVHYLIWLDLSTEQVNVNISTVWVSVSTTWHTIQPVSLIQRGQNLGRGILVMSAKAFWRYNHKPSFQAQNCCLLCVDDRFEGQNEKKTFCNFTNLLSILRSEFKKKVFLLYPVTSLCLQAA